MTLRVGTSQPLHIPWLAAMAQSRLAAISAATAVVTAISVGYHALLINTSARKRRRVREKVGSFSFLVVVHSLYL